MTVKDLALKDIGMVASIDSDPVSIMMVFSSIVEDLILWAQKNHDKTMWELQTPEEIYRKFKEEKLQEVSQ